MSFSKRHFTAIIGKKEQGSYVSSSPSSAARKAVSKLCADDKKRKVVFNIRETTRDSNKKVYGPYIGYMQKLDKPVELEGRVIRYKPVAKLDKKNKILKGGFIGHLKYQDFQTEQQSKYNFVKRIICKNRLFFGNKITRNKNGRTKYYFPVVILSDGSFRILKYLQDNIFNILKFKGINISMGNIGLFKELFINNLPDYEERFGININETLNMFKKISLTSNNSRSPFSIQDEKLDYYHRDFKEFNSSLTLYGEYHDENYTTFLENFIDSLYSTSRRQIIIVEANELEEAQKNKHEYAKLLMQPNKNRNTDKFRKKLLLKNGNQPILYFKSVFRHGGKIPNTEIILGDIRLRKLFDMILKLDEKLYADPNKNINDFISVWNEQLSVFGDSEDFSEIKNEVQGLLSTLNLSLTNKQFERISNFLNRKWVELCNINMIKYIKQYLKQGVDIILFIGAIHMDHLIEEIEKLYPVNSQNNSNRFIRKKILIVNNITEEVAETDNNEANNNFNFQEKYKNYWFYGKTRINGRDMEVGKFYQIRPKNKSHSLDLYKVIEKNGNKIKLAKLKSIEYYNKEEPKILTIRPDAIYGYEYTPREGENISVYEE